MKINFAGIIRQSLKDAYETLDGIMQGVTEEVAHWQPAGKALPIAALYTHILVSEDMMMSMFVTKEKTLLERGWQNKTGLNLPHPAMDADWEKNYVPWTKQVRIDLKKFKVYSDEVRKQTDTYLSKLTDNDMLEKKVDLSIWSLGEWPLARFIIRFLISHIDAVGGEISATKGLQGLKGYPF